MNLLFLEDALEDYQYWLQTDKTTLKKINQLIKECIRTPYSGVGKPEPLKFDLSGTWSRRINQEHRLIYKIEDNNLIILQCRYHY
ncbi:MAG: Txe/YoeB family addiction module toxin [Alphaproteobacteria bacterium]|nr:Txe/YoeB family addiction module toxin [Alphaproteobacteria bacterium]MDP3533562.1 Txe/YoeB family addiction module toxin [Alphaproteobacteria bacterium]